MILRRLREVADDKAKERERKKREKDKQKRRSRKYGQAELKHAKRGILSCMMGGLTLFLLVLVFSVSYISKGDVNILIGLVGLGALVFSVMGFAKGIQGFKEREKNYLSCKIGVGLNGTFLFALVAIFLRGLF